MWLIWHCNPKGASVVATDQCLVPGGRQGICSHHDDGGQSAHLRVSQRNVFSSPQNIEHDIDGLVLKDTTPVR